MEITLIFGLIFKLIVTQIFGEIYMLGLVSFCSGQFLEESCWVATLKEIYVFPSERAKHYPNCVLSQFEKVIYAAQGIIILPSKLFRAENNQFLVQEQK